MKMETRHVFWPRVSGDLLSLRSSGGLKSPELLKQKRNSWGYLRSGSECGGQGNEFELIPMIKIETRHTVEIYFGREYAAICYHCGVLAA